MNRQTVVCIAPKRLRLVATVCAAVAYLVVAVPLALNFVDVLARGQLRYLLLTPLLLALLVTIPSCVLWGTWALVRLLTNLPAVILTPQGIINHSIIYHVVLPWDDIESFVQFQPGTHAYKMNAILVLLRDQDRVYEAQRPLTRLFLRLFAAIRPTNISTRATTGSRETVWRELQRYVQMTPLGDRIQFVTI